MAGRKKLLRRVFDSLVERRAKQADHQIQRYLAGRDLKDRTDAEALTSR